jgi:hypothetical protein
MSLSTNPVEQPNWTRDILDWYSAGDFDVEVAAKLKVPLKEFYRQMQENAAFGRLVDYGRTLCQAFWVHQAKRNLNNKTFNATSWAFVMKNQFNWADKSEQIQGSESGNINLDELRMRINREVESYRAANMPEMKAAEAQLRLISDKQV